MTNSHDLIIIGGGPAGIISAVTARKYYPEKTIVLIKDALTSVVPCGIPYMFNTLQNPEDNIMGNAPLEKNDIQIVVDEAVSVTRKDKTVVLKSGASLKYEKLIFATGSDPILPSIKGIETKGVYPMRKELEYLKDVKKALLRATNVLIVGGGFIGVELADELSGIKDLGVFIVETLPRLLMNSFDSEFGRMAEEKLVSKGVRLILGKKAEKIEGKDRVRSVLFSDGTSVPADMVLLGIGASPNTRLAEASGLELGKGKGIWTDEYMRTVDPDVFAVGDCAGKRDFFTRKDLPVMLASTATAEARVAGANIYRLKIVRENKGTIAIYSTYVDGLVLGSAGLTESTAQREGFEIVSGTAEVPGKHPATLPGTEKIKIKLVFSKQSGIIMGGQVSGGLSAGEIINIIGMAIQKRVSYTELETLQMATHPHLTSAPTMYPLVLAAQDAIGKI